MHPVRKSMPHTCTPQPPPQAAESDARPPSPAPQAAQAPAAEDIRQLGATRAMDILLYVLYSDDQLFIRDMTIRVALEVAAEHECPELAELADARFHDKPQMYRCLFFLLLDFHAKFRFWALEEQQHGLRAVCPHKAARFLQALRADIVPRFLVNETMRPDELERELKVEYIRS